MGAGAIAVAFQELWTAAGADRGDRTPRRHFHGDDVVAIDHFARHAVAARFGVNISHAFSARQRRTHDIEIVLADDQHRQMPQRGEVQAFVEFAFIDRTLTEEAGRRRVTALHVIAERRADRQRQTAADNGIATNEALGAIKKCMEPPRPRQQPSTLP